MEWQAWFTIAVTLVTLIALAFDRPADLVFMGALVVLTLAGVLDFKSAFEGFISPSLLMVAALFVVTSGLKETGVVDYVGARVLGPVRTEFSGLAALICFAVAVSAFMNNTPIVAMLIPVVLKWCRKNLVAPSKLLIPLSFATILGGCCSRIGTSTNLVVDGLMKKSGIPGLEEMEFFEIGYAGFPCAIVGSIYLLTFGRLLLPARKELLQQFGESMREYLVELKVAPGCRLIGQTIEAAGTVPCRSRPTWLDHHPGQPRHSTGTGRPTGVYGHRGHHRGPEEYPRTGAGGSGRRRSVGCGPTASSVRSGSQPKFAADWPDSPRISVPLALQCSNCCDSSERRASDHKNRGCLPRSRRHTAAADWGQLHAGSSQ
jgi:di/tricarboxylate transporter